MGFLNKIKSLYGSDKGKKEKKRNFKYLDKLIHSGSKEIILDADIVLGKYEDDHYGKYGIKLDVDDIVIDGNGHFICSRLETRIFYCTGKNITIKNVMLRGGNARRGGAIYNKGSLNIVNVLFKSNSSYGVGGAVYNNGNLNIENSSFYDNDAYSDSFGGAIYNKGSLDILNTSFEKNNAEGLGGVIYNSGELSISKSSITNNIKTGSGGVIANSDTLSISDSVIAMNTANRELIVNNKVLKLLNCKISENKSQNNIIDNEGSSFQVFNSNFNHNQAKNIFENKFDVSNLGIFNVKFVDNNVTNSIVLNNGKFCIIEKSTFENNLSDVNSKNIINQSDLTLVSPIIKEDGKTILNDGHMLIKKSSPDVLSKTHDNGVVEFDTKIIPKKEVFDFSYLDNKIHEKKSKEIVLNQDIVFKTYEMDYYEGGIELDIDDLVIDGNGHTIDGASKSRIFIITGDNITLKNIIFKNGYSHKNYDNLLNSSGGAIKINCCSNLKIENCTFINNDSEEDGGAVLNNGNLIITKSIFNENTANQSRSKSFGGAICNWGDLTMKESKLTGNTAKDNGGAIYNKGKFNISESTLAGNIPSSVLAEGGAIYNAGEFSIHNSALSENIAYNGGAIYNTGEFSIHNSVFTGNNNSEGRKSGGAIFNTGELNICKTTLSDNSSNDGGAITNWGDLKVMESLLKKNRGGAIYNGCRLKISDSTFTENIGHYGGAVENHDTLTVIKSNFNKNDADTGGAIYSDDALTVIESNFDNNNASKTAGAIWINYNKYLNLKDCNFTQNMPNDIDNLKGKEKVKAKLQDYNEKYMDKSSDWFYI
ncbi:hypothetical protein J5751_01595 [bacterium]|nr:hypothetical protein [bacterium]